MDGINKRRRGSDGGILCGREKEPQVSMITSTQGCANGSSVGLELVEKDGEGVIRRFSMNMGQICIFECSIPIIRDGGMAAHGNRKITNV